MDEREIPLTEHLTELRNRIAWILLAWMAGSIAAWSFSEEIFGYLLRPATAALGPDGGSLQAIAPTEIFFTYLKCALLAGFVISLPVTFWNIWGFVAPGLYQSERRFALPFVLVSTFLFAGGAIFGYTFVFPLVFEFFAGFSSSFVEAAWTMKEVFSLTTRLFLAFGVGFELPVVVFFLAASGIVDPRTLLGGLKYGVLVAFILGALLTPPDIVSQVLLAGPLTVLYVLGVLVGWIFAPKKKSADGAESSERA